MFDLFPLVYGDSISMMKRSIGNWIIISLVVLNVIVWFVFPPINDGRPNFARQYAGEIIGANNIILMACSLFLSTRPRWAEPYFGGLDKMYVTHRHTSTAALLLIFVHVLTVPSRCIGGLGITSRWSRLPASSRLP